MVKAPRVFGTSQGHHPSLGLQVAPLNNGLFKSMYAERKNQTKCITDKHHSFPDLIYACNWFAHGSHVGMVDWICRDQNLRSLGEETV